MVRHDGYTASVVVDGADLPEYLTKFNTVKNELSCWIPSEAGKEFQIRFRRDGADYHSRALFRVDGRAIQNSFRWKHDTRTLLCDGAITSATTRCPLLFAKTVVTDDVTLLSSKVPSEQGDIRIEHWGVEKLQRLRGPPRTFVVSPVEIFHKSAKPVPHIACFGEEQVFPPSTASINLHRDAERLLTIVFHYRPLEYLQARCIALRPAPPRPITSPPTNEDKRTAEARPQKPSRPLKKRRASPVPEVIDICDTESEPAASGSGSQDGGDDDMAEINRLRAELEIKRMELRLADLEEQHRKKRKLNGEASGSQGATRALVASAREVATTTKKEKASPIKEEKASPVKEEKATPIKKERMTPVKKEKTTLEGNLS
ncbi:hypothetical protein CYLTODRAFT_492975 [Cylindrobasidium torrendii FP15055 ss-10]|uniref:DUF7918 domain-containing protein n=1 Tax=Cylindrobasidium torrendii FP15055 ss-10 TaxID=1314674 RepID=A0A0D7B503_9AGAR|nr:hypothetical protein CYLTODRAFT_492975 [Cylindrobasidium torrendii FP15055 ss-10]